jgi:hypothetical protein
MVTGLQIGAGDVNKCQWTILNFKFGDLLNTQPVSAQYITLIMIYMEALYQNNQISCIFASGNTTYFFDSLAVARVECKLQLNIE